MGGPWGGPGGGSRGGVQGGGPLGGVQGGGGHGRSNFFEKISFRKKTAERVAGVLARIFHPSLPGGNPPAVSAVTGPPSSDFFGKNFLKKNSTWR